MLQLNYCYISVNPPSAKPIERGSEPVIGINDTSSFAKFVYAVTNPLLYDHVYYVSYNAPLSY
jgi:hypothetical protein